MVVKEKEFELISELMHEQEWPERIYPIYANGPGYILSEDIVRFIVEENEGGTLRVCFSDISLDYCTVLFFCFKCNLYSWHVRCLYEHFVGVFLYELSWVFHW